MSSPNTTTSFRRDEYKIQARKWRIVRDVIEGDIRLKDHDFYILGIRGHNVYASLIDYYGDEFDRFSSYLRRINPDDTDQSNLNRNAQYIKTAIFTNYTGNTQNGMVGMMFRAAPTAKLPAGINYLLDDADGQGQKLWQQAKNTAANVLAVGRHGLLVDFPATDSASTPADVERGRRAFITEYYAEQIINWRTERRGALVVLSLVVLEEKEEYAVNELETKTRKIHRILRLDADGFYEMEIRSPGADSKTENVQLFQPRNGAGQRMTEIPFVFVGSETNTPKIQDAPLYDIAVVNIGHYRNSADVEENAFFAGQATVTATGMTQQWIDDVWKGRAEVGSRAVLSGPEGSTFGMIQASESNLSRSLMEDKEKQMVRLGARLIEPQFSSKTATEAEIENADSTSVLSVVAANIQDAYAKALTYAMEFMNVAGALEVEVNKKYGVAQLQAQEITALVAAMQAGALSLDSVLWNLKQGRRIAEDVDIEEEKARIESDDLGLGNAGAQNGATEPQQGQGQGNPQEQDDEAAQDDPGANE